MPSVFNHTPFASVLQPHVNERGLHCQLLVVKGVWSLRTDQLAEQPVELVVRTTPHLVRIGDLLLSQAQRQVTETRKDEQIEWYPSDFHAAKPMFDFVVCGYAYAPVACERFTASIQCDQQRADLVALAPRFWQPALLAGGGAVAGPALDRVSRVPVHPAFAYGGMFGEHFAIGNPQGMGHPGPRSQLGEQSMPWLEHPSQPIRNLASTGANLIPAAFGPWPASARHRAQYMGTYGDLWQQQRAPLPPLDFDPRYYNQADPRLQWPQPPEPGAVIQLQHLGQVANQTLRWPTVNLRLQRAGHTAQRLTPDTCIVHTEAEQYAVVWRHEIPAGESPTLSVA